ncbi:hypothetical protein ETT49_07525 [Streptococcus pyogenes]|nr:hypothetical protein ETT49_07525 [Streptococcus pyogenes]
MTFFFIRPPFSITFKQNYLITLRKRLQDMPHFNLEHSSNNDYHPLIGSQKSNSQNEFPLAWLLGKLKSHTTARPSV